MSLLQVSLVKVSVLLTTMIHIFHTFLFVVTGLPYIKPVKLNVFFFFFDDGSAPNRPPVFNICSPSFVVRLLLRVSFCLFHSLLSLFLLRDERKKRKKKRVLFSSEATEYFSFAFSLALFLCVPSFFFLLPRPL